MLQFLKIITQKMASTHQGDTNLPLEKLGKNTEETMLNEKIEMSRFIVDQLNKFVGQENHPKISSLGIIKYVTHAFLILKNFRAVDDWAANDVWIREEIPLDLVFLSSNDSILNINYRLCTQPTEFEFFSDFTRYSDSVNVNFTRRKKKNNKTYLVGKRVIISFLPALESNSALRDYDIAGYMFHKFESTFYPLWGLSLSKSVDDGALDLSDPEDGMDEELPEIPFQENNFIQPEPGLAGNF